MKKIQRIILAFMLGIVPIQSALANSKANALVDAAQNGNLEKVKTLIEKEGVDINAKETETKFGFTALIAASNSFGYSNLEIVKYLISKGADINATTNYGVTALMMASLSGSLAVVKALVEGKKAFISIFSKGADINAKDNKNRTALLDASITGHLEIVKYLISKGADINAKDNDGRTALADASANGHLEVVRYLISKGANVNTVVSMEIGGVVYSGTALDVAQTNAIKQVLKNAGAKRANEIKK